MAEETPPLPAPEAAEEGTTATEPMEEDEPPSSSPTDEGESSSNNVVDQVPKKEKGEKKDDDDDDDKKDDSSSSFGSEDFDASDDSGFEPDEDPTEVIVRGQKYKTTGNDYFKAGELDKAGRSFRKAIFDLKGLNKHNTGDAQVKALLMDLHNNLALVAFQQGKFKQSVKIASATLRIDPTNVKGLYRRAVTQRKMGNHKEAKRDLKEAYQADPTNVAVRKELRSIIQYMDEMSKREKNGMKKAFSFGLYDDKVEAEKRKAKEEKKRKKQAAEALKKRKQQWEDECVRRMAKDEPAISYEEWDKEEKEKELAAKKEAEAKRKAERKAKREADKQKQKAEEKDDDDELTESELAQLRGYKKTADGRTTSYFTREQSEEEKQLLGDIAPQRLHPQPSTTPPPTGNEETTTSTAQITPPTQKATSSVWNQGGTTWEEKDTTEWCTNALKTHLKATKATTAAGGGAFVGVVTEVSSFSGDSSVAIAGGKKRYIFDFHVTIKYEIREDDTDDIIASGSMRLPDITSASHDELEVEISSWEKKPKDDDNTTTTATTNCRTMLVTQLRKSVQNFVQDFNHHY